MYKALSPTLGPWEQSILAIIVNNNITSPCEGKARSISECGSHFEEVKPVMTQKIIKSPSVKFHFAASIRNV